MMDTIIGNPEIDQKELKPALSPIVEGRALEKFYSQPDGHRIEVIAPTDDDQPVVMAQALPPGANALQTGSVKDCY
jgi:hypothetical protein